ncbi:SUPPRESSOR OF GAMMA RESPONSE 1-like [Hibiscus syriacus]|uniref:SUPPRESSOR OF GAMMA RESPONSE 1-like n=1 Tax=Hibiscus syriacus TaxID=106335 RepID=UPI00192358A1|nr:SUPPRESSOR OF GAMMA RESPONSE 1-like [Hibiscus syriacus]
MASSRSIAKTLKNAIRICGANRECPNCHYLIVVNSGVSPQWSDLPIGVKFDPSDTELLKHLAAKCGVGGSRAHPFIHDFIPALEEDQGICYTHPENLPGAKNDGSSIYFFHRMINAYGTGRRKRRRIQNRYNITEEYRWHKTGKTKPVIENGIHQGWKKIMVLYKSSKRVRKSEKSNWVMHQYHLGAEEEERDGEYVVSKISYRQPKQTKKSDDRISIEEPDNSIIRTSTPTMNPKTITPNRPWPQKSMMYEDDIVEDVHQDAAISEMNRLDNSVRAPGTTEASTGNKYTCTCGISELENLEFSSMENIFSWLDQL